MLKSDIGQTIVLVHDPPRITCHSIQTGKLEREIPLADGFDSIASLTRVWWFTEEKVLASDIPDIFKRFGVEVSLLCLYQVHDAQIQAQTGTTLSVLRMLPLLDNVAEAAQSTG